MKKASASKKFMAMMALATMAASVPASASPSNPNKEGVCISYKPSPYFINKNVFGGFSGNANPNKHRFGVLNQRQYRKWMRQCPHMRRSKKFRNK